jgi:hypothetical protein
MTTTESLTISQALRRAKKLKGNLAELSERALACVTYPAEDPPAFSYASTVDAIRDTRVTLINLQTDIARANANTSIDVEGKQVTLAYAIRLLAEIKSEIAWTRSIKSKAQERTAEAAWAVDPKGERVMVNRAIQCHVPEARKVEMVARLQDRFDKLNDLVETANHRTLIAGAGR